MDMLEAQTFEARDLGGPLVMEPEPAPVPMDMGAEMGGGFGGEMMPPDPAMMDPAEARMGQQKTLQPKLDRFAAKVTLYLHDLWRECDALRDSRKFKDRLKRNNRSGKNAAKLEFTPFGAVKKNSTDGHLTQGVKMGWAWQAGATAASYIQGAFFDSAETFFVVSGRGEKEENNELPDIITAAVEKDFDSGDWETVGRRMINGIPNWGMSTLRYEMVSELCFDEYNGSWSEYRKKLKPSFTLWPIEDVWITNPEMPDAKDQQGVFWVARGMTRADLEKNEATHRLDFSDPFFPIRKKDGKYFNLEKLRAIEDSSMAYANQSPSESSIGEESDRGRGVSGFPKYDLYDYEGALPMQAWAMEGAFDHELAQFFEIDVGIPLPGPGQEMDERTKKEFARRLNRIPSFTISYLRDGDSQSLGLTELLVAFAPFKAKRRRNSLYGFRYFTDPDEFYGLSINDVGWPLEAAADLLANEQIRLARLSADPPGVYSKRGAKNPVVEEIAKLCRPGGRMPAEANLKPEDFLKLFEAFEPKDAINVLLSQLKVEYELVTGVSAVSKGLNQSKTATQDQIAQQETQNRLNDVVVGISREARRLIWDVIRDRIDMEGLEAYLAFAMEAAGRSADEIETYIESAESLERDIKIDHPLTTGRDRAVMGQGILNYKASAPPGLHDEEAVAKLYYATIGIPKSQKLFNAKFKPITPQKEHQHLREGTNVSPNIQEDVLGHEGAHKIELQKATMELQAMQSGLMPVSPEDLAAQEAYVMKLQFHLMATEQIKPMALQFQMQMAMATAGLGGAQPGGAAVPPGGMNPGMPGDQFQVSNAMSANANEVPGQAGAAPGSGYG